MIGKLGWDLRISYDIKTRGSSMGGIDGPDPVNGFIEFALGWTKPRKETLTVALA
jgi:hypothetical protein